MNKKYKDLTKNTVLFALSSFGTKIMSFFLVPLYTNVLTITEYGMADILLTVSALLIVLFTINIADGILIFAMDSKQDPKEVLSFGFRVMYIGWGLLIIASSLTYVLGITDWPEYCYVFAALYFLISVFYQILSSYMRATEHVRDVAIAGIVSSVAYIVSNILFLLIFKIGLTGYLISIIIEPLAGGCYIAVMAKLPLQNYFVSHYKKADQRALIVYCIPLIFNSIALWINSCLDRYFVVAICGVEQNGLYAVASKIPVVLSTFYMVFAQAWTLSAVKEFDRKDQNAFFSNTYAVYNAAMAIVCSGLILFNITLAELLYAKDFFVAWEYSSTLLLASFFNALTVFTGGIFSAAKESKVLATTTVTSAGINTILNAILIPLMGVQGAAIATAVALACMWLHRIICVKKIIFLKIEWKKDMLVYILLVIQIIIEHTVSHAYFIQIAILGSIIALNRKQLEAIIRTILKK